MKFLKEMFWMLIGFANMLVGCSSAMMFTLSADRVYHHWTAFHVIGVTASIFVTSCTTLAAFVFGQQQNEINKPL